ncbi:MAG: hypothetical protein AAGC68_12590, partial [Verrucomicrobiota bacterium]
MRNFFFCVALAVIGISFSSSMFSEDGARLRQAFERLDGNDDGQLSVSERGAFPQLRQRLGETADTN